MKHWLLFLSLFFLVLGCGNPSLLITPVSNTNALEEQRLAPGRGMFADKIAVIEVEGMLINAREGGLLSSGENKVSLFKQQLEAAASDSRVKAVVLRINSPGGTVTASDTMYQELIRFKKQTGKPVVSSTQEIAASGAYYLACGSDKIVAHPTSVVGSIGVIFQTFNVQGTMQLLGIKTEAIKSGKMKDMASPFRPLDDESKEVMQRIVLEYYDRFVEIVKTNRKLTDEQKIKLATDGRVFTGEQAVRLGLVDRTGMLEDAIDLARELGKAPGSEVIGYKRPFGYSGSIYAQGPTRLPGANVVQLVDVPDSMKLSPGFYYLWNP